MRDRLIELITKSQSVDTWNYHTDDFKEPNPIEELADYLLANGVIAPPCKVGDTVYFLDFCVTAEDFEKEYIDFGKVYRLLISKYGKMCYLDTGRMFSCDSFNKTVFLTKEEAENALKEREHG